MGLAGTHLYWLSTASRMAVVLLGCVKGRGARREATAATA
jgi:hypothetical protein